MQANTGTTRRRRYNPAANNHRRDAAATKTIAAVRQALAQQSDIPERTAAVARLRLDHPSASLGELAAMIGPTVSKYSVAGHLRRLVATTRAQR